jgi:hypothetical protein
MQTAPFEPIEIRGDPFVNRTIPWFDTVPISARAIPGLPRA